MPDARLSGHPRWRCCRARALRGATRRFRSGCHPYRDRGPARHGDAARSASRTGRPVHHRYTTRAFPEYVQARYRPAAALRPTPGSRRFHAPSRRRCWRTPVDSAPHLAARGFDQLRPWSARRRPRPVSTLGARAWPASCAAADLPLCRAASRWRRTSRPSSRSTCPGPRWSSATGRTRRAGIAASPAVRFTGMAAGRAPRPALCRRGRLRLPEPHRHLRPGAARGDGLRHAGRGLTRSPAPVDVIGILRPPRPGRGPGKRPRSPPPPFAAAAGLGQRFSWEAATRQFAMHLQPRMRRSTGPRRRLTTSGANARARAARSRARPTSSQVTAREHEREKYSGASEILGALRQTVRARADAVDRRLDARVQGALRRAPAPPSRSTHRVPPASPALMQRAHPHGGEQDLLPERALVTNARLLPSPTANRRTHRTEPSPARGFPCAGFRFSGRSSTGVGKRWSSRKSPHLQAREGLHAPVGAGNCASSWASRPCR